MDSKKIPFRLQPAAFQHPLDTQAILRFANARTIVQSVQRLHTRWQDPKVKVELLGDGIKVTPKQFPDLYQMLIEASQIMDVLPPEMYVVQSPEINAYAIGAAQYFIKLTNSMIELMDDDELFFIIGHELGHIKNNHVLYHQVAATQAETAAAIGAIGLGTRTSWGLLLGLGAGAYSASIIGALKAWIPMSELTADRAGLIACQNVKDASTALIKVSVGSKSMFEQIDMQEYLKQAMELNSLLNQGVATSTRSHPFTATRVQYVAAYGQSPEYQTILNSAASLEVRERGNVHLPDGFHWCPVCGDPTVQAGSFCISCGANLLQHCRSCGFKVESKYLHCPSCGNKLEKG